LVAIYLYDWRQKQENWGEIANVIKRKAGKILDWRTVLACLYSLANDKENLLKAILQSDLTFDGHDLALSTLLSQPAPIDDQQVALVKLMQDGINCIRPEWVQEWLSTNHPVLAVRFARWMLEQDKPPTYGSYLGQVGDLLAEISNLSWQAYLCNQSNAQIEALELLEQARRQTNWLVAELASSWVNSAEQFAPDSTIPESISKAWECAIQSAPVSDEDRIRLPYFFDYIQSQLRKDVLPDVKALKPPRWQGTHSTVSLMKTVSMVTMKIW
jgi:hypothetical protein